MLKYEIKITEGSHPRAVAVFEDDSLMLLSEFLSAECQFRRDILAAVNEVDFGSSDEESFSGNVFTLTVTPEFCRVESELDEDREPVEVPTEDFKQLLLDFIYVQRTLSVKEKLARHKHDHTHCHHGGGEE